MARSPLLVPMALVLVFALFFSGCVSSRPRGSDGGPNVYRTDGADGGAQKVRGGPRDARVALFAIGVFVITFVVIVDLIILPFTIPNDRPFCCTQEVVVVCFVD